MKVLVFYTVTLSVLFAALTVLFSALGIGTGEAPARTTVGQPAVVDTPVAELFEDAPTQDIKYNFLLDKKTYQVEMSVALYTQRGENPGTAVTLPAKGIFLVERRIDAPDALWYRVLVSDGRSRHRLFLRAADLNWQTVKRYSDRPLSKGQRELEIRQQLAREDPLAALREVLGRRRPAPDRQALAEAQRLQEEAEMQNMQSKLNTGLQTFNAQGMLSSALLAGIVTVAMAAMLGALAWLRHTKRWTAGSDIEALWGDESEYLTDDDDDYRQQRLPDSHDPYA